MVNVGCAWFKISVQIKHSNKTLFYLNVLCWHFQHFQTQIPNKPLMNARVSPSLLKAGASTPVKATASLLMWAVISSELALLQHGGLRSVGKTSVKEKRGSVYLSQLVGHDFHFDLSADQLLDRLASSRSHKVTLSATKGPAWGLDSTCKDESASSGIPAGAVKISFYEAPRLVDFHYTVNDWQIIPKYTQTWCSSVLWQLIQVKYYLSSTAIKVLMTRQILFSTNESWSKFHGEDLQ